ncbi:MAG: hypothetical protein K5930_02675 [Treponemataceae bacterium]|nr:hypothetical protein [Treponemataceae bacterium]
MEKELDLYSKSFRGFYYWQYIREETYTSIISKINNDGVSFNKTHFNSLELFKNIARIIFSKKYSIKNYKGSKSVLIFCHPRRILENGKYVSQYTDPIANIFDDSLTCEHPNEGCHYVPCETKNIFYTDRLFYIRSIISKLWRLKLTDSEIGDIRDTLYIISKRIKNFSNVVINPDSILSKVFHLYKYYVITKKYFKNMLPIVKAKVIIEVVYYRFENMVVNELLHEMKVPIIELQHGLTGRYHVAYNWAIYDCEYKILPDYILCFSDFWKNQMRLPLKTVKVLSTGFPYYEESIRKYPTCEKRNAIIFISSGTIGEKLSRLAVSLQNLLIKAKVNYSIVYKLHPGEYSTWQESYPWLLESGVMVVDNADVSIYKLFSKSIAQVGVYSTALFEGLGYNLKTFILNIGHLEHVQVLIDSRYAILVNSAEDIMFGMDSDSIDYDTNLFWKENAKESTINAIRNIVNLGFDCNA